MFKWNQLSDIEEQLNHIQYYLLNLSLTSKFTLNHLVATCPLLITFCKQCLDKTLVFLEALPDKFISGDVNQVYSLCLV